MALFLSWLAFLFTIFELLHSGQKILKIGWNGWTNILMISLAKYTRPVDVSYLSTPPPPIAQNNVQALNSIGFRRVGEAQIKYPFRPPLTVWVFAHMESQISAEVAWKRVEFATYFREKTLLVTDFPNGEHIETPNYQCHTIVTSVGSAYNYHLQQVAKFSHKYGQPHPIRNMLDYLRWEKVGRVNYGGRKLMRWAVANIIRLVAFIYGILVLFLTPIYFEQLKTSFLPPTGLFSSQSGLLDLMILLILPAIIINQSFNSWTVRQTHKDSRNVKKDSGETT